MTAANWNDDSIQFPRLLCEIVATCEMDYDALCASMDLEPEQINELFERAHIAWEVSKDRTSRDLLRSKLSLEAQRGEQEKTDWMVSMREYVARINVPDDGEVNDGVEPLGARLAATLYISTLPMHLEAWEVTYDADGMQIHSAYPEDLELLHTAVGGDGSFTTLTINGREYVIVASPFC